MPTPSKPPGQRRRRNANQGAARVLPAAGRADPAPNLPDDQDWLASTVAWWAEIWKSPMATAWLPSETESLVRLARLKDDFDRGEAPAVALQAIQRLEDRFGLSPKARQNLGWQIETEEPERQRATRRRSGGRARRLRVVDPAER